MFPEQVPPDYVQIRAAARYCGAFRLYGRRDVPLLEAKVDTAADLEMQGNSSLVSLIALQRVRMITENGQWPRYTFTFTDLAATVRVTFSLRLPTFSVHHHHHLKPTLTLRQHFPLFRCHRRPRKTRIHKHKYIFSPYNQTLQLMNFSLMQLDVVDLFTQGAVFPYILKMRGAQDSPGGSSSPVKVCGRTLAVRHPP